MRAFRGLSCLSGIVVAGALPASIASAAESSFTAEASPELSMADQGGGSSDYLHRYAPTDNLFELGAYAGMLFISDHNSFRGSPTVVDGTPRLRPYSEFNQPSPEFGVRAAYFPLSFLGGELEGMFASASAASGDDATILSGRAQLIVQAPFWSVVPFALGGAGYWASLNDVSGDDSDPAFHFGGGVKVAANGDLAFRLDVRDTITNQRAVGEYPNHVEVQLGASVVLGRAEPAPVDADGDGILAPTDACPSQPGIAPDGCPASDRDSDQIFDGDDRCPDEPGLAPTGCPSDLDSDGVIDSNDQCVNEAGPAPAGCPDRDADKVLDKNDQCPDEPGVFPLGCPGDSDRDAILDPVDACVDEPETQNGFEDTDGCPDVLPEAVARFNGVIPGIEFDLNKDSIRPSSHAMLDEAVKVLSQFGDLRVKIVGHSDDTGAREHNIALSTRRAEAVRSYLVSRGITAERIEASGVGPDQPLVAEKTALARQKNRRIEFQIVK